MVSSFLDVAGVGIASSSLRDRKNQLSYDSDTAAVSFLRPKRVRYVTDRTWLVILYLMRLCVSFG